MHLEIGAHLPPLLGEQHRQERAGSERAADQGQGARPQTRPERSRPAPVRRQQIPPDPGVALLDVGEARIEVALARILLGRAQEPVEVRRLRLVLPVMGKGVEVWRGRLSGER